MKATIHRADGTRIELDGTPEDIRVALLGLSLWPKWDPVLPLPTLPTYPVYPQPWPWQWEPVIYTTTSTDSTVRVS